MPETQFARMHFRHDDCWLIGQALLGSMPLHSFRDDVLPLAKRDFTGIPEPSQVPWDILLYF